MITHHVTTRPRAAGPGLRWSVALVVASMLAACSGDETGAGAAGGDPPGEGGSTGSGSAGGGGEAGGTASSSGTTGTTGSTSTGGVEVSDVRIEVQGPWSLDAGNGDWPRVYGVLVNDAERPIGGLTEVVAWFDGGEPVTFPVVETYDGLVGAAGGRDSFRFWFFHLTGGPEAGQASAMGTFNSSGRLVQNQAATAMEPYAEGELHVALRGTLDDGTPWEASASFSPEE